MRFKNRSGKKRSRRGLYRLVDQMVEQELHSSYYIFREVPEDGVIEHIRKYSTTFLLDCRKRNSRG